MRGGKREGAGHPKPPIPLKQRNLRLSDIEYHKVKIYVKTLRNKPIIEDT
jgi:hypothetical protein